MYSDDVEILKYLQKETEGYKESKYFYSNHAARRHNDAGLASLIKQDIANVEQLALRYPRCPVCTNYRVSLIDSDRCGIGLFDIIPQDMLDSRTIIDKRIVPIRSYPIQPQGLKLFDFQQEAADKLIAATRGIGKIPTGGGKTELDIYLSMRTGVKTTIVVPKILIMQQFIKRYEKYGIKVGQWGGGKKQAGHVTIAVVNSLCDNSPESNTLLNNTDCLILDEAHRYGADSWFPKLMSCHAYYRFGLSATPWRGERIETLKLVGLTGKHAVDVSVQKLQDEGFLAKAEVMMIDVGDGAMLRPLPDESWNSIRKRFVFNNSKRTERIVKAVNYFHKQGKHILILGGWDEYCQILERAISSSGIATSYLTGGISVKKIDKVKEAFAKTRLMLATTVADEGMDIPRIDVLILAAGGRDSKTTIQRVGRALRTSDGKDNAIIVDFIDSQQTQLYRHSQHRINAYASLKLPVAKYRW